MRLLSHCFSLLYPFSLKNRLVCCSCVSPMPHQGDILIEWIFGGGDCCSPELLDTTVLEVEMEKPLDVFTRKFGEGVVVCKTLIGMDD